VGLHEWAAFAAQQSAEKAAKALIQHRRGSARGHSVTGLLRQLQDTEPLLDAARELDLVYITSRYPNGLAEGSPSEHFSAATSERLIEHARTILEFCRSQIH
jgi:HEPN domain-containing protein